MTGRPLHPNRSGAVKDLIYTDFPMSEIATRNNMSLRLVMTIAAEEDVDGSRRAAIRNLVHKKMKLEADLIRVNQALEKMRGDR